MRKLRESATDIDFRIETCGILQCRGRGVDALCIGCVVYRAHVYCTVQCSTVQAACVDRLYSEHPEHCKPAQHSVTASSRPALHSSVLFVMCEML